jgi:hypothetical protein
MLAANFDSHHLLTIASEDKLHHAPIKKDIEVSLVFMSRE